MKAFQASQQQQHSSQEAMEIDNNNNNKSQNHLPSSNGDKTESDNSIIDVFRWSRCKKPLPQKLMRSIGFPLPPDHVEVKHFISILNSCFTKFLVLQNS